MKRIAFLLLCGALGCGGGGPSGNGSDAGVCALADGSVVPLGAEICDGIDNDCNGVVDDGSAAVGKTVYADADGDGYGDARFPMADTCPMPGWVLLGADGLFDCNDGDPTISPTYPLTCDFDGDYTIGAVDCNDHDPAIHLDAVERCDGVDNDCDGLVDDADQVGRYPADARYSKDDDGDGYPTTIVFACSPPGAGFVLDPAPRELDCAPTDAAIHPDQLDDCASQTDLNCDGVFRPVHISEPGYRLPLVGYREERFTMSGPTDPPTTVYFAGDGHTTTIDICPGTYRVSLELGGLGEGRLPSTIIFRGQGATPADVVFDAGGVTSNARVMPASDYEFSYGDVEARFENLTLANGANATSTTGCIVQIDDNTPGHADVVLENVVLRDCRAANGGAILAQQGNALTLTNTTFLRTSATVAGGAIHFSGRSLTMTGGGFTNVSAPAGTGAAIAASLSGTATIDLVGVDLGGVTDDLAVTTTGAPILRDLGASATLHCDVATGCTP